jgi:hypothetical protein
MVLGTQAELVPDPRDDRLRWVRLTVHVAGSVPAGIGYRVVVEADPDMISRGTS